MKVRATKLTAIASAIQKLLGTFTPQSLFKSGVNGAWYDPSDMATLFQDSAGTTPVTAMEQPVGLMLDRSKGLVLGSELVTNGDFDSDTSWIIDADAGRLSISGGRAIFNGASAYKAFRQQGRVVSDRTYQLIIDVAYVTSGSIYVPGILNSVITTPGVKRYILTSSTPDIILMSANLGATAAVNSISVRELPGNHAFQSTSANRPTLSARYNQYVGTETMATQSVTTVAANYKLTFTGTGSITLSGTATGTYTAGIYTITCTAGTMTSTVSGSVTQADLRVANDVLNQPAYQRVNTSTDYDTAGFKPYLRFNGTSSSMQTNSIDFRYGDKVFFSAGVRKLSDAAGAIIVETSADLNSNNGTFYFGYAVPAGNNNWMVASRGTTISIVNASGFSAPITSVVSGTASISSDQAVIRVNGIQSATDASDQGTGNYGNYPLYLGARGGSSLWFNGRLYGLVVAGKAASAGEIASTEAWLNNKTRAY